MALLTPLNVNCHAGDGRKVYTAHTLPPPLLRLVYTVRLCFYVHVQSTPLHLAAGYNRVGVVELLLQQGADVHAKDKG